MTRLFSSEQFDTPCRIEIEQSSEHFHAHVELDGNIEIQPGDRVRVHGDPVMVAFGESVVFHQNQEQEDCVTIASTGNESPFYF